MPHFTCAACTADLYSAARPVDLLADRCPACGLPLEPGASAATKPLAQPTVRLENQP